MLVLKKYYLVLALAGLLLPVTVIANPSVSGNRISWLDDGWYQVQVAGTDTELCAGTRFCDVPDGNYVVINHTSGERFERIAVGDDLGAGSHPVSPVTVTGFRINWPDDGWYQVQDAVTYESVCNGTTYCEVPTGIYNVINHTKGIRYESISVTGTTTEDNTVIVEGNRLSWPDNGWYQVQNAETFEELCGGGTSCMVPDGSYIVINHSNGQRFEDIVVPDTHGTTDAPQLTAANARSVWKQIVAVINERKINAHFGLLADELNFQNKQFFLSNTVDDIVFSESINVDPPFRFETDFGSNEFVDVSRSSVYTCAAGGGIQSYNPAEINGGAVIFQQCVIGAATYNGSVGLRNIFRGAISRQPFSHFERRAGDVFTSVTGEAFGGNQSFVVTNRRDGWRSLDFQYNDTLRLDDYSIERITVDSEFDNGNHGGVFVDGEFLSVNRYNRQNRIVGSFSVSAPWTGGFVWFVDVGLGFADDVLLISGQPNREFSTRDPVKAFEWESGSVVITANDGSRMNARPTGNSANAFTLTVDNGETIGPIVSEGEFEILR